MECNITDKGNILMICCGYCSGRYYYWNTETDEVSWLSPEHPRAVITLPAERLKGFASSLVQMNILDATRINFFKILNKLDLF